jgi:hypothetical protein
MDELYEQARKNVMDTMENEIEKEYKRLVYISELKEADDEKMDEIRRLFECSKEIRPKGFIDAMGVEGLQNKLEEYVESGSYHPIELKKLKYFVLGRLS